MPDIQADTATSFNDNSSVLSNNYLIISHQKASLNERKSLLRLVGVNGR
jgi:hypothetical protein